MTQPRFSPMPPTRLEQILTFVAALGFGLSLLLTYQGLSNHFLVEQATLFGKWPLLVLPALALLVGYLVFWIQKSDWPISLPFRVQPAFFEKTQRQVRLLLRLLNAWMQLVLAALLFGYNAQWSPAILLFLMITALLVDVVMLFYFIMRLSRFASV